MSLTKYAQTAYYAAVPAVLAQPYSRACPSPPPAPTPNPPPSNSGGLPVGCYNVPLWQAVPGGISLSGPSYVIVGYIQVCA